MPALRLLELQSEFSGFEETEGILALAGMKTDRTKAAIAAEYGEVLRQFISSSSS